MSGGDGDRDDGREGSTSPPKTTTTTAALHNYNPPPHPPPPQNPPPRAPPTNPSQLTPLQPPGFFKCHAKYHCTTNASSLASASRRAVQPQSLLAQSPALRPSPSTTGRKGPYKALRMNATPPHEIPADRPKVSKKRRKLENRKDDKDEKGGPSGGGIPG
ncbi:homeobox protein aristaless-like [Hibiscus syriacus]|uniref:homeobox protein aristaless-like n=1 Tax=Hibiscus syriacus TaxID=106335 RepID=UPI0019204DDA|nr:homeobox protein aristaless-like [Hibiscus syriacus]